MCKHVDGPLPTSDNLHQTHLAVKRLFSRLTLVFCATIRDMAKTGKRGGVMGRRTTGIRPGEKASEYQKVTLRLPEDAVRSEERRVGKECRL